MTEEQSKHISEIDARINTIEAYLRDLKNERNKIILFDICENILTDDQMIRKLKGEEL